MAKQNRLAFT